MGRGARLASFRQAAEARWQTEGSANRAPDNQDDAIAGYLVDRKASLVTAVDDEEVSDFKVAQVAQQILCLSEVARLCGIAQEKRKKAKPQKPAPGESLDHFKLYLAKTATPKGWRETIGKKLEETAANCLERVLKGDDVTHSRALRWECLKLSRYLANVEAEGVAAEARLNAATLRRMNG